MAVKQASANKSAETQVSTDTQTPDNVSATGAPANGAAKRGPKGPRTTAPLEWNREMMSALVDILKPPKKPNEVRTAALVAYELNKTPAFADNPVTAQQVASYVASLQKSLPNPKKGEDRAPMPVPPWLTLDVVKRQTVDTEFWGSLVG